MHINQRPFSRTSTCINHFGVIGTLWQVLLSNVTAHYQYPALMFLINGHLVVIKDDWTIYDVLCMAPYGANEMK